MDYEDDYDDDSYDSYSENSDSSSVDSEYDSEEEYDHDHEYGDEGELKGGAYSLASDFYGGAGTAAGAKKALALKKNRRWQRYLARNGDKGYKRAKLISMFKAHERKRRNRKAKEARARKANKSMKCAPKKKKTTKKKTTCKAPARKAVASTKKATASTKKAPAKKTIAITKELYESIKYIADTLRKSEGVAVDPMDPMQSFSRTSSSSRPAKVVPYDYVDANTGYDFSII